METSVYADKGCPSRKVLDRIGDTWSVMVVGSLADGPMRYTELARRISGVSPKMLTQTLRTLERDGLLTRTVHAVVPPRVDYELTGLGRSLLTLVDGLRLWAETHIDEVTEAQAAYDAR
ncbi:winged helix-turn-helix transcriptional regulator [Umezawaea tangerina]|uniref:winged helix-turn-helix transcriptional regulator n=1 Tax=Umezawaea tangerina TaxID=84725 RepID=UPI000AEFE324|nr:helix-turn-helix domain-containing protein [Umezawaea tangerina]